MARPKKPPSESKNNVLRIRLTTDERAELDHAAARDGMETSTWARDWLLTLTRQMAKGKKPD